MRNLIRGTLLGVSLCAVSALTIARTAPEPAHTSVVRYGDLDLSRMDGAVMLYRRIRGAARNVCGPLAASDLVAIAFVRDCEEHAIAGAVADVNAPLLTSYYMGSTGRPAPALAGR